MKKTNQHLLTEHLDRKLSRLEDLRDFEVSPKGWIHQIRTALNMSLRQLGERLGITPQSTKDLETREASGSVTIKTMDEVGRSLGLKFIYGFVPIDKNIEEMIQDRAWEKAKEIVERTSHSMSLEDQENSQERLKKAIEERARSIRDEMPRHLWD